MEWLMALVGIASLVGSFFFSNQQMENEKETLDYNKELNQKVMDREDNAWQRAVVDRSKSGLSIAGLSQGSGSGGTVSQLQAPQGSGMMANLLQNISGQSFGLAQSSYEGRKARKLQQENFMSELELKKEQLENEKINSLYNRLNLLADLNLRKEANSREQKIYDHNMKIATGEYTDPKKRVYGTQPSDLERIVTSLYNQYNLNKDTIKDKFDEFTGNLSDGINDFKTDVKDKVDTFASKRDNAKNTIKTTIGLDSTDPGYFISKNDIKSMINEFSLERSGILDADKIYFMHTIKSADGKEKYATFKDNKGNKYKIALNAREFEDLEKWSKEY